MLVDSPLSCIMFVVGAPTRDFWSFSWASKARHSGPRSTESSSTTSPHSVQTVSPCSSSTTSFPLHSGQSIDVSSFSVVRSCSWVRVRVFESLMCWNLLSGRLIPVKIPGY